MKGLNRISVSQMVCAVGTPLTVRRFKTIEELRLALLKFSQIYNENWIMHRHKYKTPAQFRRDIIDNRAMAA